MRFGGSSSATDAFGFRAIRSPEDEPDGGAGRQADRDAKDDEYPAPRAFFLVVHALISSGQMTTVMRSAARVIAVYRQRFAFSRKAAPSSKTMMLDH